MKKINLESLCYCDLNTTNVIRIRNREIQTVSQDTFKGLSSLRVLDLAYNKLTEIDGPAMFDALNLIQELN